jgi:phenylacetic acid degradation operon negative regulatory protein
VEAIELTDERPTTRQQSAKALLFTILGEFVLPAGGDVWTSTLIAGCDSLDIGEKNARQAVSRLGEQGIIESARHGRRVRWSLTPSGRSLLESGAERIYTFGRSTVDWDGSWLLVHCPVAESQRSVRYSLRTQLRFLGFGELAPSLLISPQTQREPQLRRVLADLDADDGSSVLRSRAASHDEDLELVSRAWDVTALEGDYRSFIDDFDQRHPEAPADYFRHTVELVHHWRRFPFADPELPISLLPQPWAGSTATDTFHRCRDRWSAKASAWFDAQEASVDA